MSGGRQSDAKPVNSHARESGNSEAQARRVALGRCLRESEDKDLRAGFISSRTLRFGEGISCFAILDLRLTVEDSDTFVFTDHGQR